MCIRDSVRAGRRHKSSSRQNYCPCTRTARYTHRYRAKPSCGSVRYNLFFLKYHGKRPRPEMISQFFRGRRNLLRNLFQRRKFCNMHDQRIVRGPSFGRIRLCRRRFIQRIRSQSLYRFCRKSDQTPGPQNPSCFLYRVYFHVIGIQFSYRCV